VPTKGKSKRESIRPQERFSERVVFCAQTVILRHSLPILRDPRPVLAGLSKSQVWQRPVAVLELHQVPHQRLIRE
jgi:hypothetical protein